MNGYTENLADFGYMEQDKAKDIFEAWKLNGLPRDFDNDGVKLAFNMNSGNVFLTNAEYQVSMCGDNEELYSFLKRNKYEYHLAGIGDLKYLTPDCGDEEQVNKKFQERINGFVSSPSFQPIYQKENLYVVFKIV